MGGIPMAEHDSLSPRNCGTTGGAGVTTLGETKRTKTKSNRFHF